MFKLSRCWPNFRRISYSGSSQGSVDKNSVIPVISLRLTRLKWSKEGLNCYCKCYPVFLELLIAISFQSFKTVVANSDNRWRLTLSLLALRPAMFFDLGWISLTIPSRFSCFSAQLKIASISRELCRLNKIRVYKYISNTAQTNLRNLSELTKDTVIAVYQ